MSRIGHSPVSVLQVGPAPDAMGGMASVVNQIDGLAVGSGFVLRRFVGTSAPRERESALAKGARHLIALFRLAHTIRSSRSAIVHIHTCSGFSFYRSLVDGFVARAMRRRTVLHVHGASFDEFFEQSSWFGGRIVRLGLRSVDRVVALSESWKAKLNRMSPRARVAVIENAVALPDVAGASPSCATGIDQEGPCRFLMLARMDKWKGIDDLLEACTHLKEQSVSFELTLAGPAGSAGDARSLPQRIVHLGLADRVRYVGEARGPDKDKLLRTSDAYVQSSHNEGMPIAVLEALAYGLPVVATDVGSLSEVITQEREGLIVPPREPSELARAMARVASDKRARGEMARAGRDLARRRFSESRLRNDLVRLYSRLVTGDDDSTATIQAEVTARRSSITQTESGLESRHIAPGSVLSGGMKVERASDEASAVS